MRVPGKRTSVQEETLRNDMDFSAFSKEVTNRRADVFKPKYESKMNRIDVQIINIDPPETQKPGTELSVRRRSATMMRHRSSNEKIEKFIEIRRCVSTDATNRTLAMKMVKNMGRETRKISLHWSAYSASRPLVTDELQFNHVRHLQRIYFAKWRSFVEKKIASKLTMEKNPQRQKFECVKSPVPRKTCERAKVENLKLQNQEKKISEQADTIRELELIRLKLEEQLFARDVKQMIKENGVKAPDKTEVNSSGRLGGSQSAKKDLDSLKAGWEWVMRMELRAQERQQRRDSIRERRRLLEMERAEKARLDEENRKRQEDERKKRKALEIKREIQRRDELKRKQEEERIRLNNLNASADEHYRSHLLRVSFTSFVSFRDECRSSRAHAEKYYNLKLLSNALMALNLFRKVETDKKTDAADEFFEQLLLKRSFNAFKKIHLDYLLKMKKSEESNKFRLIRNYFSKWFALYVNEKCESLKKYELAVQHYEWSLMRRYFQNWKQLLLIHFHEREKEQRFRTWYSKVQELLPDFQPSNVIEC